MTTTNADAAARSFNYAAKDITESQGNFASGSFDAMGPGNFNGYGYYYYAIGS